jgi:precorrin-6A/cobalt-precorrin-6A reductase
MPMMDSHRIGVLSGARTDVSETVMRILILGGTTEASELARLSAGDQRFSPTLALAGRIAAPAQFPIPCRVGGFGGAERLADWLDAEHIRAVVDATHPFAARISANARAAAQRRELPLLVLRRDPWKLTDGDRWVRVPDIDAAVAELGLGAQRVFLTIGRQHVGAFRAAPQHDYLVRCIEPPAPNALPPRCRLLLHRGPFDIEAEGELLQAQAIDVVVAKNSGGGATYAKIAAARRLGLPVIMIERPVEPAGATVRSARAAMDWLSYLLGHDHKGVASERGV